METSNPAEGEAQRPGVDTDLLVWAIVALVLVAGLESVLVGWGLNQAAQHVSQLPRPDRLLEFIKLVAALIAPLIALNAALGYHFARSLSLPLFHVRKAMNEVARGNLEHEMALPSGGLLHDYAVDCQKMLQILRRLVYRDHQSAAEAGELLAKAQKLLGEPGEPGRKEARELVGQARALLSVVNYHFTKGRREQA